MFLMYIILFSSAVKGLSLSDTFQSSGALEQCLIGNIRPGLSIRLEKLSGLSLKNLKKYIGHLMTNQ